MAENMNTEIVEVTTNQITKAQNSIDIPEGFVCTIDRTTIDGQITVASALAGGVSMRDMVGETLRVVDFVQTPGVRARTGEVCVNSYIICDDGNTYFSQSAGIARSIPIMVGSFADPITGDFDVISKGIGFKVIEQNLANGNTFKSLIPVKL